MKKLICMGDSLTEGVDIEKQYRWPSLLANMLPLEIENKGIGGDTSAGILARFPSEVIGGTPDFITILCGTNDLWWGLDINPILANIFSMCCQANFYGIAPIVGTPLPVVTERVKSFGMSPPLGGFEKCAEKLSRFADMITKSAEQSEIACIDFYRAFLDEHGKSKTDLFLEDGLHPNRSGHRLMAEMLAETFHREFLFRPNHFDQ